MNSFNASHHIIRLHGPWRYEPLECTRAENGVGSLFRPTDSPMENVAAEKDSRPLHVRPAGESLAPPDGLPPAGTVKIPADWAAALGPDFRGRVLYKRHFATPTNLDPQERVDLVLHKINGRATVTFNGSRLGEIAIDAAPRRFELTSLLRPRNELRIEVNLPPDYTAAAAGGIVGDVHLEIYEVTE